MQVTERLGRNHEAARSPFAAGGAAATAYGDRDCPVGRSRRLVVESSSGSDNRRRPGREGDASAALLRCSCRGEPRRRDEAHINIPCNPESGDAWGLLPRDRARDRCSAATSRCRRRNRAAVAASLPAASRFAASSRSWRPRAAIMMATCLRSVRDNASSR